MRIHITGAVQGVGFRPHVFRLARELHLSGWVLNSVEGVRIEVEGGHAAVERFANALRTAPPPLALIASFDIAEIAEQRSSTFEVRTSDAAGTPAAYLLPDLALCPACRDDILTPGNRRHRYAFTSCTNCGPRYSIVEGIPYDRPLTAMRHFPMCAACTAEYRDPANRRFHAQTNACPDCGPRLELWNATGAVMDHPLETAIASIRQGAIVAVKGLGGFHLVCDARNSEAIAQLRARKHRPSKPFAVMMPDIAAARSHCTVDDAAAQLLSSPQAPIVLLDRAPAATLPASLAPGNPTLGIMLPYTPLHALLMAGLGFPIVATSGNLSDEPICIDEHEALHRLHGIADAFLIHNRPILRPVDDSVVAFLRGHAVLLRRARGYAPLPIDTGRALPEWFATGSHMKNTVAFSRGRHIFLSQHLGDLETEAGANGHARAAADFQRIYNVDPAGVAHDLHPDYGSTRSAEKWNVPRRGVQHHEAHILACIAEHQHTGAVFGIAWDGSGFGIDKTVWGGEYLDFDGARFTRLAHLRTFPLPGGEQAVKEPRRSLLGLLDELGMRDHARHLFTASEWRPIAMALDRRINAPTTSSAGRLFDAAAALIGLPAKCSFEGEAAMALEYAARGGNTEQAVPLPVHNGVVDWGPLIAELLSRPAAQAEKARVFHNSLAASAVDAARIAARSTVALTGGCFQNALLTTLCADKLEQAGFRVLTHCALPPNDGAIAAGQIAAAAWEVQSCA